MNTRESRLSDPVHITVDGASIATYVLVPERGAPQGDVVFCHGTPWSSQVWADAARHLSSRYRVFMWDMPGYGRSPNDPAVPIDLASQMSRFAQLLTYWRLDRRGRGDTRSVGIAVLPTGRRPCRRVRGTPSHAPHGLGQGVHRRCCTPPVDNRLGRYFESAVVGGIRSVGLLPSDRCAPA
ncbi:alpha/beta fold hydrolase [Streptomyces sp. IBSBF 2807]|nr:alpha/beta fold hydrolase [Streptomyces hilarionis]